MSFRGWWLREKPSCHRCHQILSRNKPHQQMNFYDQFLCLLFIPIYVQPLTDSTGSSDGRAIRWTDILIYLCQKAGRKSAISDSYLLSFCLSSSSFRPLDTCLITVYVIMKWSYRFPSALTHYSSRQFTRKLTIHHRSTRIMAVPRKRHGFLLLPMRSANKCLIETINPVESLRQIDFMATPEEHIEHGLISSWS